MAEGNNRPRPQEGPLQQHPPQSRQDTTQQEQHSSGNEPLGGGGKGQYLIPHTKLLGARKKLWGSGLEATGGSAGPRKWPLTWSTGPGSSQELQHSAHSTALTESTNPKELTIVVFHFIAKISTINLTTEKISVSPASYSASLRKHK